MVVGNELLSGHTQDANGPFLAEALRGLGHRVRRITIVPDTVEEVTDALEDAAGRAGLVLVCGGLGPTLDDITIDGVARFLGRPLETPEEAREQLRRVYRLGKERGFLKSDDVDEGAWRMARIPAGGIVVPNRQGVAPGSVHTLERGGRTLTLYVLPGPPGELQSVWRDLLEAELVPPGDVEALAEVHLATFEAPVAHHLQALSDAFPSVGVGSYPQHGEKRVIVRLSGSEEDVEAAAAWVRDRLGEIELDPR